MSEILPTGPEQQSNSNQQSGLILRGIAKSLNAVRRVRIDMLDNSIRQHEDDVSNIDTTLEVNSMTARYTLETGPDTTKAQDPMIEDQHKIDMRPITRKERKVVRKTERAIRSNARRGGVARDLHRIYDVQTPGYKPDALPDRRPGIGRDKTKPSRDSVDERLRREGLLKDLPPREAAPVIELGSEERRDIIRNQRVSNKESKTFSRADRALERHVGRANRKIEYVERVGDNTDRIAKRYLRKQKRLDNKISRKQDKKDKLLNKLK